MSDKKPAVRHVEKRRTSTCRFADRVAEACLDIYRRVVPAAFRTAQQTCIAGIVAIDDDSLQVVALGVGTKFLAATELEDDSGRRVRDCHAEVLARRAFRRYLTEWIIQDAHNPNNASLSFVLERVESTNGAKHGMRYRLRPSVTLHFYCSSAPCGNAVLKKFERMQKERFRDDLAPNEWPTERHAAMPGHSRRLGQFGLLLKKDTTVDNDGLPSQSQRTLLSDKESQWPVHAMRDWCPPGTTTVWSTSQTHTCSDKLARWQCLGLQGSLLASVIQPLYASTLVVGRKLTSVTCRRAVCCRVGVDEPGTPLPCWQNLEASRYRLVHPAILGTAVYVDESGVVDMSLDRDPGQDVRFHSSRSFVWWPGLDEAEGIHGTTGYRMPGEARPSRVSTAALVELFLEIPRPPSDAGVAPRTLGELAEFKRRVSPDYEQHKDLLLTRHPTLKYWRRRNLVQG